MLSEREPKCQLAEAVDCPNGRNPKPAPHRPTGKRNGRSFIMDAEVSGFGVKVTETGSRSYVFIKRFPGFKHPAPRQLGSCDAMTLEEARDKARSWLKLIACGIDPVDHEREIQLAAARKRENSFAAVFEDFVKEKLSKERKGGNVERDMRKEFVAAWGKRPIADITDRGFLRSSGRSKARAPAFARNLLGYAPPILRLGDRSTRLWNQDQSLYRA